MDLLSKLFRATLAWLPSAAFFATGCCWLYVAACTVTLPPDQKQQIALEIETIVCDGIEVAIQQIPVVGSDLGPVELAACESVFAALDAQLSQDGGLLGASAARFVVRDSRGHVRGVFRSADRAARFQAQGGAK